MKHVVAQYCCCKTLDACVTFVGEVTAVSITCRHVLPCFCSVLLCFALLIYIHFMTDKQQLFRKNFATERHLIHLRPKASGAGLVIKIPSSSACHNTRGRHFSSSTTPLPHFTPPPPPHHHYHHQLLSRSLRFPWQSQRQHRRLSFHKTQTLPPSCLKKKKKKREKKLRRPSAKIPPLVLSIHFVPRFSS